MVLLWWSVGAVGEDSVPGGAVGGACSKLALAAMARPVLHLRQKTSAWAS